MAFTAADVGPKIDLLLDGNGFLFDETIDPTSLYSSRQRAQYGLSPVFVQRQNVSGDYGDNQQDFFLTFTQKDWSEGEQQRFFRQSDADSQRRYWIGTGIDVLQPGFAKMRKSISSLTFAAAAVVAAGTGATNSRIYFATSTNLYSVSSNGTITDRGAHGLTATPTAIAIDGDGVYLSGGGVGVRRWKISTQAFSTFSATIAKELAFLNNTLYGLAASDGSLIRYDTAGAVSTLFTWKDSVGVATTTQLRLQRFGGKLLILRLGEQISELWIYDGSGTFKVAELPSNFLLIDTATGAITADIAIVEGTVVVGGALAHPSGSTKPAIWYYASGTTGLLWQANDYTANAGVTALAAFDGGLVFTDYSTLGFMFYNLGTGGTHTFGAFSAGGLAGSRIATADSYFIHTQGTTTGYLFPGSGVLSSSTLTTSLDDFDSSLTKNFYAVRVEFDSATDGNGGTVDVAYRVGDVDGSYTSLATGITSGSEVLFSSVSGKSISIKVTLNKGTSTSGPVLKRISLRASPILPQYPNVLYTVGCYGHDRAPDAGRRMRLRDETYHPSSGAQMAAALKASAAKTTPISITDELNGTFTGVILPESVNIDRIRPGEFRAQFQVRGV